MVDMEYRKSLNSGAPQESHGSKKNDHSNASWHNVLTESISGNKNYLIHFFGNFIREHFRHQLKTLLDGGTQSILVSQETQIYFWI